MRILAVGFAAYVVAVICASAVGVYLLLPLTAELHSADEAPITRVAVASVTPPAAAAAPAEPAADPAPPEPAAPAVDAVAAEDVPTPAPDPEPEILLAADEEWSPASRLGLLIALIEAERDADVASTRLELLPPVGPAISDVSESAPVIVPVAVPANAPDVDMLLQRGDALLATGDVSAARLFYARAAELGGAQSAIALAKSYDPLFLAQAGHRTVRGDAAQAATWYRRAVGAGSADAAARLERLLAVAAQPKS